MASLILFGDQTVDCNSFLLNICSQKGNVLLTSLLEQAGIALQEEISRMPQSQQTPNISGFKNVADLVSRYRASSHSSPALDSSLVVLSQLAHFIGSSSEQESDLYNRLPSDVHLIGMCIGLFAATAISSATSLSSLIPLAIEVLRLSFRAGSRVADLAEKLEPASRESWATAVHIKDLERLEAALEEFHSENNIPEINRAWISVSSRNSATISGPPAVVKRLFQSSDYLSTLETIKVAIQGPYHARHLFSKSDLRKIISYNTAVIFGSSSIRFPVYSSATGKPFSASSPLELIEQCLEEILMEPLNWANVCNTCSSGDICAAESSCDVSVFGLTPFASSLAAALKMANVQVTTNTDPWPATRISSEEALGSRAVASVGCPIAIVGYSGRFPNAANHELLWDLLAKGLDVHREVPKNRFNVETHVDDEGKIRNTSHTPYGCFIDEPGLFDARFFNMSPREALQTDPMQRLTLVTAYEAMEMAGIVPNQTPSTKADRIGTFYGQTSDDWREINAAQDIDTYFISGGVRAFGPGRVNYHFKFSGPSFSIDTACSSSLAAIQLACTSLQARECDTAFTGGSNVLTNPDIFSGLSRGHFLSKTGSCKTFDNDADGYCRGDGVATVILKRLEDALLDKDPIFGVIRGSATNHSAEAVSITHPHAGAQKALFSSVLRDAGVDAYDVNYVEMHGTGTQAGDGVEMDSVSSVFAPPSRKFRREDQPLFLGAIKANIGHGEAVSGACALIKILLMLQKNAIPPHAGIKGVINKSFPSDMKERNINIAMKRTEFPRPLGGSRKVMLNNFSAAGGNTAVLLEDGPLRPLAQGKDPRSAQVVCVTAKSLASFRTNLARLKSYINEHPDANLSSVAYTSTSRRIHYNYRLAFAVDSLSQLKSSFEAAEPPSPIPSTLASVVFMFTGQGSQYAAMGSVLFASSKQFRADLESFSQLSESLGFSSFLHIIDPSIESEGAEALSPVTLQIGMVCLQIALVRLWASWGIKPDLVIGHSLGEYAALNAAGVLSIVDTLYLVGIRAKLLVSKCAPGTHGMLAVKAAPEVLQPLLDGEYLELACINGPSEVVVSGTVSQIRKIGDDLKSRSLSSRVLDVPFAFHSSQVDPILSHFEEAARSVAFHPPKIPVLSSVLGKVIREAGSFTPSFLARHCRDPVNFAGTLVSAMQEKLVDSKSVWLEIGPHPICSGMVKSTIVPSPVTIPSLRRGESAWKTISTSISVLYSNGFSPDWKAFHHDFEAFSEKLDLPRYGFDEKVYWLDYTNDWCLSKGQPSKATPAVEVVPKEPKIKSTSIHRLVHETVSDGTATVVAETDLQDARLHAAVSGHLVNGAGLCPSSIYADMALTIANHSYELLEPKRNDLRMNVRSMECPAPLILKNLKTPEHQLIQIEAKMNLGLRQAGVIISSLGGDGKTKTVHGKCIVDFEDAEKWLIEWDRNAFLIQTRIEMLQESLEDGTAHKILRGMAYKLFSSLVQYSDKFRGMKEVILGNGALEAMSRVEFQAIAADGDFHTSPYYIDSVAHLAGFIMNANDAVDSASQVYISHGWESMRFAKPLEEDKKYTSYVKMQPLRGGASKMFAGDVYVFDDANQIIGVVGALKFQCIPRKLLNTFLPPAGKAADAVHPTPAITKVSVAEIKKVGGKPIAKNALVSRPEAAKVDVKFSNNATETLQRVIQSSFGRPSATLDKAINIIAVEVGVDTSELADNIQFADLGVDSLMSLTISGRFREELDLEVQSTLFTDFPSIRDLKVFLSQQETSLDAQLVISSAESTENSDERDTCSGSVSDYSSNVTSPRNDTEEVISLIRVTIAEEMGMNIEEIADTTDLTQIGMDSLMSLTILGILRERTGFSFDSSFLNENRSIAEIRSALGFESKSTRSPLDPVISISNGNSALLTTQPSAQAISDALAKSIEIAKLPPATSVLLQGSARTATQKLFLLPDGSGSATSYAAIPAINSQKLCVYGLNCPFMKNPTAYTCGIEKVSTLYLNEIIRRQKDGPYLLGGWSAGGVVAYEVTRQLVALQEQNPTKNFTVSNLILIDSPCPIRLEPLPARLHIFFNQIGLLGTGDPKDTPSWLLPHFQSSIRNLSAYQPVEATKFDGMPKTLLIWAEDGVCKFPSDLRPEKTDDEPKSMSWLLDNRTDFSPNNWDKLVGAHNCTCVRVTGNHFTMMRDPVERDLARLMRAELNL